MPDLPAAASLTALALCTAGLTYALIGPSQHGDHLMDRPNPLAQIASKVGVAWSAASGLVSALITFGVLTVAQGDAVTAAGDAAPGTITALGTIVAGLLPIISGVVAAFRTAAAGRDVVTPVESPRDNDGNVLTPAGT